MKILNPKGTMVVRANFYNVVDGITVIDNTGDELHQPGEVLDTMAPVCGTDALDAIWTLQRALKALGLRLEAVAVGRKRRTMIKPGKSTSDVQTQY
jgi:hypothetical protein